MPNERRHWTILGKKASISQIGYLIQLLNLICYEGSDD